MNDYDLCLIMCPPWDVGRPPINIAYLTEFMRSKGYRVWTKDLNIGLEGTWFATTGLAYRAPM